MGYHPDWDVQCPVCGHPKPCHENGTCDGDIVVNKTGDGLTTSQDCACTYDFDKTAEGTPV